MSPSDFLHKALQAAQMAGHIYPEHAACEAALESAWGTSHLATECNNLFGQKQGHTTSQYPVKPMPTHEWVAGHLVPAIANWPVFPDWETSFRERMILLKALPIYADALLAPDGESFIRLVSVHWATDPQRAYKILAIAAAHHTTLFGPTTTTSPDQ